MIEPDGYMIDVTDEGRVMLDRLLMIDISGNPYRGILPMQDKVKIGMRSTHIVCSVPSLWGWLKLWWRYRRNA